MIFEIETILTILVLLVIGTSIIYSGRKKKTGKSLGLVPKGNLVPETSNNVPRNSKKKKNLKKNINISTTEKGKELEIEFAKYMKKHLGYSDVRLGKKVVGLDAKNTDIDILGLKKELVGKHTRKRWTWVECKNYQSNVGIKLLRDFNRDVEYYKKTKNPDYKITDVYFVASSGFTTQALNFAKENNIYCYKKDRNDFDLVEHP